MHFLLVLVQQRALCCPHSPILASPVDGVRARVPGWHPRRSPLGPVWAESQHTGAAVSMRSSAAELTSGWQTAQCVVQVNFIRWHQLSVKYWWQGEGIGRVNIFSTSLVISIFSLSFFPLSSPPHPTLDATLMRLFCSIEHVGMADFPCLGGALDQELILQVYWAPEPEKRGKKRMRQQRNKPSPGKRFN